MHATLCRAHYVLVPQWICPYISFIKVCIYIFLDILYITHLELILIVVRISQPETSGRAVLDIGLRPGVAGITGSNPTEGMDVCLLCLYVVLSYVGRGLCDGLITHPEESYCVFNCVWFKKPQYAGGHGTSSVVCSAIEEGREGFLKKRIKYLGVLR
jgi:hypothetical protein